VLVRTIDNYAPMPTYDVHCSVAGLPDGVHVLRIVVLGEGRPAAKGTLVSVESFGVTPEGTECIGHVSTERRGHPSVLPIT